MPGPGQVFQDPKDGAMLLWVRQEERQGRPGDLFVSTSRRVVFTRWLPEDEAANFELVNDHAGRAEAQVFREEGAELRWEKDALQDTLKHVTGWLTPEQTEELRMFYHRRHKKAQRK